MATTNPDGTRPRRLCFLRSAWALVFLTASLSAQRPNEGAVTGVVTNQATGAFLSGAIIAVEGTATSITTERGGTYTLSLPRAPIRWW